MRRTTLQRKDRDELTHIARALGGDPSNRARKDEIISLILELAGHSDGSAAASAGPAAADGDGDRPGPAGAEATAPARNASGPDPADETAGGGPDDEDAGGDRGYSETDPGNRRRKRRTRDRDRDRDDGWDGDTVPVSGHLDLRDEGYGFLRVGGCLPTRNDAYVPVKTIRQHGLRRGDHLTGTSRPANRTEKNPALVTLDSINGGPPELSPRPRFAQLAPVHAPRQLVLELPGAADSGNGDNGHQDSESLAGRLIDLVAPVGVGQRVLVMVPRHSGAGPVLGSIMTAVEANEPGFTVMGLFLDQQPEAITEMERCVQRGEVAATAFDQPAEEHVQTAEMVVERAKRAVELGDDVVLVVDGLTALARAYNTALSNAGRAYSGNVESGAVHMPKKFFGAGRNLSGAGSLTMIATLATGGKDSVDRVVAGELAGRANTEIHLDRWAAELGHRPAIDVLASVSHDEGRFLDADELAVLRRVRRELAEAGGDGPGASVAALEAALGRLRASSTNADLLARPAGL